MISVNAIAEVYMSSEAAAKLFFPSEVFKKKSIALKDDEKNKVEQLSDAKVKSSNLNLLVSKDGSVVFTDQVIGKHEQITYAVGISKSGKIQGVEILEYRESYGYQIKREAWKKQFVGKDKSSALKLDNDIQNISGATISSSHVTDGVRRIMQTYEQIKNRL